MDKVPKKKIASVNFSHALFSLLDFFILEYGADRLFQNVSKELQLCAAYHFRRAQIVHDLVMQALVLLGMVRV